MKKEKTKIIATGKIFKIFNNDWGVKIIFNAIVKKMNNNETEWKQIHFNVFKKTQNDLIEKVLALPKQRYIKIVGYLYNYQETFSCEQYIYKESEVLVTDGEERIFPEA